MQIELTAQTIPELTDPMFRAYAEMYLNIQQEYFADIERLGLSFAAPYNPQGRNELALDIQTLKRLEGKGLTISNAGRSLHTGWISPSCVQCRRGLETVTEALSTQCPKDCFFCFNPNQSNYAALREAVADVNGALDGYAAKGMNMTDIALTGGEPLMHKEKTISYFQHAEEVFPGSYTRLYTSGAYLDEETLARLRDACLDEIRFSVKMDEPEGARRKLLGLMRLAKDYIPHVVVEMPVMPDQVEEMKQLLLDLDEVGINGINLLELCYPLHNGPEFARRGYFIKNPPFNVLYNYWYSGGLPIDGSADACMELLEFALDSKLSLGVHYCSLENKFTSQLFLQNRGYRKAFPLYTLSDTDCFLKCGKVFGADGRKVATIAKTTGKFKVRQDAEDTSVSFPLSAMGILSKLAPSMQVAISYAVMEGEPGSETLRELKLTMTTPGLYDPKTDL